MNQGPSILVPKPEARARSGGEDKIGIVAWAPTPPGIGLSLFTVLLFRSIFEAGLRNAGLKLEREDIGFVHGPEFVAVTFEVQDRRGGLRVLHDTARDFGLLAYCEIAFFDGAENYWRTVYPQPAAPFARFLTPEKFQASEELVHEEISWTETVLAELKSRTGKTGEEGSKRAANGQRGQQ